MKKILVLIGVLVSTLLIASPFTKGTIEAKKLYTIAADGRSNEDMILLQSLQGILAQNSDEQIFLYLDSDEGYQPTNDDVSKGLTTGSLFWLDYLKKQKKIKIVDFGSEPIESFIGQFKDSVKGAFLYKNYSYTPDLATTYAGITNKLPLTSSNKSIATVLGFEVEDTGISNMNYGSFYQAYKEGISNAFGVELDPTELLGPRDYAAQHGALVYYNGSVMHPASEVTKFLFADGNIPIFGWNASSGDEGNFVNRISKAGNFVVASDHSYNLSVYSSSKTKPKKAPQVSDVIKYDANKVYVTFIVSDGDNLQFVTNKANDSRWWGNEHRGEFPIGWTMPPALYYLESDVWNYFVDTASKNDEFIVGPSGIGYVFGNVTQSMDKFKDQLQSLQEFMLDSGIQTSAVFGDNYGDWYINEISTYLDTMASTEAVKGLFYAQFSPWMEQANKEFGVIWSSSDKPVMPQNISLGDDGDIDNVVNTLNDDSYNQGFYAVYAKRNDEDNTIDRLAKINSAIKDNVQVVSPSQLVDLLQQSR